MSLGLYLFMIEATASKALAKAKSELAEGERYAINCFAVESSIDAAKKPLPGFFGKLGWSDVSIVKEKQVPPKLSAIPDPQMQQLAKVAGEKGVAFMVYSKSAETAPQTKQ